MVKSSGKSSGVRRGRMRVAGTLKASDKVPHEPGLYRITSKTTNKILYVGQTNDLRRRFLEHKRDGHINFKVNRFFWSEAGSADPDMLCKTEVAHIKKHKPRRNKTKGGNGKRGKKYSDKKK